MDQQAAVTAVRAFSWRPLIAWCSSAMKETPMHDSSFKVAATMLGGAALLKISALAIAAAILGLTSPAQAGSLGRLCTSAPERQWLPIQELQAKVETLGFKVQKGKLKNACGELYTLDKNGNRVELFVDPTNGQIVGRL